MQVSADGGKILYGAGELREGYTPYLVKFAARDDDAYTGRLEQAYALMARAAGVHMPETRMLGAKGRHPGWFAARRFDRDGDRRVHVHTLSGLLHAPHTVPSLGYGDVLLATRHLTRNEADVVEMFRRACFNVFARNRDDHSRNFAFCMDESGAWRASPAYDLTLSSGPGGEHAMLVGSVGRAPTATHLLAVAREVGVKRAKVVIDEVRAAVSRFSEFADMAGLPKRVRNSVGKQLG